MKVLFILSNWNWKLRIWTWFNLIAHDQKIINMQNNMDEMNQDHELQGPYIDINTRKDAFTQIDY